MLTFTIPGKPVPQGRPRVMRGGWAYDPPKSKAAKKIVSDIAAYALLAHNSSNLGPDCCSRIDIRIKFYGARKNADLDNLYKLVTDACQGIVYSNDSQIDRSLIFRLEAKKGEERTEVEVIEL